MQRNSARHRTPASGGFTLIELLVVIALIGILASIILASLNNARSKARDTTRVANLRTIQTGLELYADGHGGQYPATLATLVTTGALTTLPTDPNTGTTYAYIAYSTVSGGAGVCNNGYHLGAIMENTTPVKGTQFTGNGTYRCSGSSYTGNSDCSINGNSAYCLPGSVGDFSGAGNNVYDICTAQSSVSGFSTCK
ncbi:MAG: type II secretion system protein [Candidatus Pacebacteria bacterium]|nr:type II secretion system protein [Candidatus Paceibacterota bacterium]